MHEKAVSLPTLPHWRGNQIDSATCGLWTVRNLTVSKRPAFVCHCRGRILKSCSSKMQTHKSTTAKGISLAQKYFPCSVRSLKRKKEKSSVLTFHLTSRLLPSHLPPTTLPTRCLRLDLQPLAYLWRRDQESLLSEMISSQLHAILIKVAAYGESLPPLRVLKNVAAPLPPLLLLLFSG